jgi:micrococcal nuclease
MNLICTVVGACLNVVIQGQATVIDGDTIRVAGAKVRLEGVDAEELNEPNGYSAKAAMEAIIAGKPVRCTLSGAKSYDREVGTCENFQGLELNAEIIRQGRALDCERYSHGKYRGLEPVGAREKLIAKPYCRSRQ